MSFQLHHFTITFSYGPKQPIKLLRKIWVYQCKENKPVSIEIVPKLDYYNNVTKTWLLQQQYPIHDPFM